MKKFARATLVMMLAFALCIPVLSFAESASDNEPQQGSHATDVESVVESALEKLDTNEPVQQEPVVNPATIQAEPTGNCTATIKYYENVTYPEPGYEPNDDGRYLLGTRTITGLSEGDVLDTWDFVVPIKGFMFFDAWPAKLTISTDSSKNVIELFYFREWSSAYTVNYYMMVGADLTANSWTGALSNRDVEFIKFDTETFENQPYGKLVEGDAYEYRLDGKYVVDTYPPEIRVGTDADNNVINVLYVPDSVHLPDDIAISDDIIPGEGTTGSVTGGTTGVSSSGSTGTAGASGSTTPSLPEDEVISKDEMSGLLPEGLTGQEIDQLFKDFIGSQADAGNLQITDEMLANPMSQSEALEESMAYRSGFEEGQSQADQLNASQEGQQAEGETFVHVLCIVLIVLLLILSIIGYILFARERKRNSELQEQLEVLTAQVSAQAPIQAPGQATASQDPNGSMPADANNGR